MSVATGRGRLLRIPADSCRAGQSRPVEGIRSSQLAVSRPCPSPDEFWYSLQALHRLSLPRRVQSCSCQRLAVPTSHSSPRCQAGLTAVTHPLRAGCRDSGRSRACFSLGRSTASRRSRPSQDQPVCRRHHGRGDVQCRF